MLSYRVDEGQDGATNAGDTKVPQRTRLVVAAACEWHGYEEDPVGKCGQSAATDGPR